MANEYREKYLSLKNEHTILKNQQSGLLNDVKREVETHWTTEVRRTDDIYRHEVNQLEKMYKEQDGHIDQLKEENTYLLKQIETQAKENQELKNKY